MATTKAEVLDMYACAALQGLITREKAPNPQSARYLSEMQEQRAELVIEAFDYAEAAWKLRAAKLSAP